VKASRHQSDGTTSLKVLLNTSHESDDAAQITPSKHLSNQVVFDRFHSLVVFQLCDPWKKEIAKVFIVITLLSFVFLILLGL
jgi:hypothetical protein